MTSWAGTLPGFLFPYAGISGRLPGTFIRLPDLLATSPGILNRLRCFLTLLGPVLFTGSQERLAGSLILGPGRYHQAYYAGRRCVCVYSHVYMRMYICVYKYVYICMCICIYAYMYVF